ncbi:MAG: FtsW/RodA/SpoVE family cell cycle protein [Clostridia bacterium]|nr:FtsW/RodA/SpoVE family cell cycle protein [Clostridia bacterium]
MGGSKLDGFIAVVFDIIVIILRVAVSVLSVLILVKIYSSLRHNRRDERPLIMLYDEFSKKAVPVLCWENSIGRSKSCDIFINDATVSREHAVLLRRDSGWSITDTGSKSGVFVNGEKINQRTNIYLNDEIRIGSTTLTVKRAEEFEGVSRRSWFFVPKGKKSISPKKLLLLLSIYFFIITLETCLTNKNLETGIIDLMPFTYGLIVIGLMWGTYLFTSLVLKRVNFEIESLAFFLTGLGIMLSVHQSERQALVQIISAVIGIIMFECLIKFLEDPDRVNLYTKWIYIASLGLLAVNLIFGKTEYGAANWIVLPGGISVQPSEVVKVGFVIVGSGSLDKLQTNKNLLGFIVFSALCVGALALMGDFGTALIFFATFLLLSFMRSGDFKTLVLAVTSAIFASTIVLRFKPYITDRFKAWRHVFEEPYVWDTGYQQARTLIYCASGGLFGVGIGNGFCKTLFASESDIVIGVVCEEMGIVVALVISIAIGALVFYARAITTRSRSTFYSISACCAAGLLVVQLSLNIFGATDILPLTGVTFPFISAGGSSMIACWGLFSFIKAADERTYAVKKQGLFSTSEF